eukprot:CAMPEP_0119432550 /NCGR_PEP_ID=MMETSP1335-20130426/48009_1 /TAXON_ID=259385 /ORGANISM="Chrysoculter rhomboideus, Strain RCC1486" /LENGTH=317 /DNA_ID=CAMNT_0007458377 /DNA_START=51 /DNA_END=1004 /DNA_ORIENTATION=+
MATSATSSLLSRDVCIDIAAGWVAGAASIFASQPLDTVLTRLQQAPPTSRPSAVAREVRATGGVRALWRGAAPLVGVVPVQNALLFAGYGAGERFAKYLAAPEGTGAAACQGGSQLQYYAAVFAGGCSGGVLQSFVVSPVELVKVQLQLGRGSARHGGGSVLACAHEVYATVGVPAFWRGLSATLLRDGVPHGVWFASYEWSKLGLEEANRRADGVAPADAVPLTSGAFAATLAWLVGYPADIIKTRIQGASMTAGGVPAPSVLETARALVREANGNVWRAFYRGFGLKLARAVPMNALSFVVYERAKAYCEEAWAP